MARKNNGYQTLADAADPAQSTADQLPPVPAQLTKSPSQNSITNNQSTGITTGSAGVPPKIINPTKQSFTQSHQLQSPIHSQIPGSANFTAQTNTAAAAAAAAAASGSGSSSAAGTSVAGAAGRPTALTTAHNLPTAGNVAGGASNAAINQRGKVKQPMRTTKTSQKLTLFPEEKDVPILEDEYVFDDTTYNQIGQLSSSM